MRPSRPARLLALLAALTAGLACARAPAGAPPDAGSPRTSAPAAPPDAGTPAPRPLTVHFLDVGQGDALLVVSPTGRTVLIDAGPPEAAPRLVARLRELVTGPLDLAILTHPHLDHLGGMEEALRALGARRYLDPGFDHPSRAYADLLRAVAETAGAVVTPTPDPGAPHAPLVIGLGEGAALHVLWPRAPVEPFLTDTRSDANSNSVVLKLVYGRTALLLMGDAEPDTEAHLLRQPLDLRATVLKVGHHGGRHSSTARFLAAVRPGAAVVSVGRGNDYGHPTPEALRRLATAGARVLRTDLHGEVVAESDGAQVTVRAARGGLRPLVLPGGLEAGAPVARGPLRPLAQGPGSAGRTPGPADAPDLDAAAPKAPGARPAPYVSLAGSDVFHRASCPALARAKTKERARYATRAAAAAAGKRPAKDCNP